MQAIRSSASLDVTILKEPRGFIRIVQLILAIFAFATLTSVTNSCSTFSVKCSVNQTDTYKVCYGYPFRLSSTAAQAVPRFLCNRTSESQFMDFYNDSTSSAEFFCFIGVMTFLICIGLVILYVFFMDMYNSRTIIPKGDFIFSATWTLLWFIASAAWADGYVRLSTYLSPAELIKEAQDKYSQCMTFQCEAGHSGDNSTLIVSVLFGFLNTLLWGASLWFLFKETEWHKARQQAASGGGSQFDQQQSPGGVGPQAGTVGGGTQTNVY